jgi:hypothetical protein
MAMNIKAWRAEIDRLIAEIEAEFDKPTPAPHPLAGLEYEGKGMPGKWFVTGDNGFFEQYPHAYMVRKWRDFTTHAPVPLWQVAKRLGVEHPVPNAVRWTDVEWLNDDHNLWESATTWPKSSWISCNGGMDARRDYRLIAQYDHQEITYAQFRKILGREDKPASEVECKAATANDNPLYQVGDLVEVVEKFGPWFYVGERFFVHRVDGEYIIRRDKMMIASEQVRLISRP